MLRPWKPVLLPASSSPSCRHTRGSIPSSWTEHSRLIASLLGSRSHRQHRIGTDTVVAHSQHQVYTRRKSLPTPVPSLVAHLYRVRSLSTVILILRWKLCSACHRALSQRHPTCEHYPAPWTRSPRYHEPTELATGCSSAAQAPSRRPTSDEISLVARTAGGLKNRLSPSLPIRNPRY